MRQFSTVLIFALAGAILFIDVGLAEEPDSPQQTIPVAEEKTTLADLIPRGYRVMSVMVPAFGGPEIVVPSDRVDVLVYMPPKSADADARPSVRTLLQDIKVLAVNQVFDRAPPVDRASSSDTTVTLLVTPQQGQRLALAAELGKIRLMLRNPEDDVLEDSQPAKSIGDDWSDEFGPAQGNTANKELKAGTKPILDLLDRMAKKSKIENVPKEPDGKLRHTIDKLGEQVDRLQQDLKQLRDEVKELSRRLPK